MRISKIDIPQKIITNGLKPIKMNRLGQLVLLAGKNGSGKSRTLSLIQQILNQKPTEQAIEQNKQNILSWHDSILHNENNLKNWNDQISQNNTLKKNYERNINNAMKNIENTKKAIQQAEEIVSWNYIETDIHSEKYTIIPFVPKKLELTDYGKLNRDSIKANADSINNIEVNGLPNGTLSRIFKTQERWFNATHQDSKVGDDDKRAAIDDYKNLKTIIKTYLGTELDRTVDGDPTLFGFPIGKANLSDGQKVLLQLSLAIHCQQSSMDNIILFLDEPENHLHPSVLIETIETIIEKTPNGQVWIATHSIPLLANFDSSSIWYIDNGEIHYSGNTPEKVLESLLGDENKISKLHDFLSLPGVHSLNKHAYESLFHPLSVMTDSSDPQIIQINDQLLEYIGDSENIRILDYGVGKGRLLANLSDIFSKNNNKLCEKVDYIAYDKYDFDKEECLDILKHTYSKSYNNRYFNDLYALYEIYDKKSFDVVIMCNVFHEIDPSEWIKLFKEDGEITSLLSEKGVLLIVEDQEMQVGEKAYQKGFIVLNTPELKELFIITENNDNFKRNDARGDGRLISHIIPKDYLKNITQETRRKCLESLHAKAKNKILDIRAKEIKYKNGKKHGFWVQQYANTGLVLDEI